MKAWIEKEPLLSFGRGDRHVDPKAGLWQYGPIQAVGQEHPAPAIINVGIIGTSGTISKTHQWINRMNSHIESGSKDSILFPAFPGFPIAFKAKLQTFKSIHERIPEDVVEHIAKLQDVRERVVQAGKTYKDRMDSLDGAEPRPNIVVCSIPKKYEDYCASTKAHKIRLTPAERLRAKLRKKGQRLIEDFGDDVVPLIHAETRGSDLRARIKRFAMKFGFPTQLIRESTLSSNGTTQPIGTVAWNFGVALYFKAGGYPWRLAEFKEGTCFVGVTFYRERGFDPQMMGTSVAQVFDRTGEGLVIRGDRVVWDREDRGSPYLEEGSAKKLLREVIEAYSLRAGQSPKRVVIHKSSRFRDGELAGFEKALPKNATPDFLALGTGTLRAVRDGEYPPLRGTVLRLGSPNMLVYTMGYIPYLETYPGHHIPKPIHVLEHHGETTSEEVAQEILSLTKLNWNNSQFCTGVPVTLGFSRRVSTILAETPENENVQHSYRFYM